MQTHALILMHVLYVNAFAFAPIYATVASSKVETAKNALKEAFSKTTFILRSLALWLWWGRRRATFLHQMIQTECGEWAWVSNGNQWYVFKGWKRWVCMKKGSNWHNLNKPQLEMHHFADIPQSSGEASGWRHVVEEFEDAEKDA